MNIGTLGTIFSIVVFHSLFDSSAVRSRYVPGNVHCSAVVSLTKDLQRFDELGDIRPALEDLSSGENSRIKRGRIRLLAHAKGSTVGRKQVIDALMLSMNKPNLNIERDLQDYYLWREGSTLLEDLKATEALDLLIAHLDMTNGFHSTSMVFQPAILGVRKIGLPAVPKLTEALLNSPKPGIRMAATYCLTEIGGLYAMDALKRAQINETSQCVKRFVNSSLSTFTYKAKGQEVFGIGAPQATADARQDWLMAFECID
ncbi:MAG TPA: hypothetical protein DC054_19415 [Blastocatellia bacterium]|nr:hypothetical protein [Blastocatellia bacterium]